MNENGNQSVVHVVFRVCGRYFIGGQVPPGNKDHARVGLVFLTCIL